MRMFSGVNLNKRALCIVMMINLLQNIHDLESSGFKMHSLIKKALWHVRLPVISLISLVVLSCNICIFFCSRSHVVVLIMSGCGLKLYTAILIDVFIKNTSNSTVNLIKLHL